MMEMKVMMAVPESLEPWDRYGIGIDMSA